MKKVILFLIFSLLLLTLSAQPISNRSSTVITVQDGNLFALNSFRPACFIDTTAANAITTLDSCGKLFFSYSDNSYWMRGCSPKKWIKVLNTGNIFSNNGLTKNGDTIKLGGTLTANTTIDLNGDSLNFTGLAGGWIKVRAAGLGYPLLVLENTTPGASENLHIVGPLASIRMLGTSATPFAAITQYTGSDMSSGNLRNSYGYDGPANHVFLCDLRNGVNSATFEINGSTLAGFSGITGNLFGGQGSTPDTAALNLFRVGTGLTSASQQMLLYGANYGSSYNTTSGTITNRLSFLRNSSVRSSGGNNLTNIALHLQSFGAQINQALFIDSGDVVIGSVFDATASTNNCNLYTVSNTSSTQKRIQENISRTVFYNDTLAGSEPNGSASLKAVTRYDAKALMTIPDNISGSSAEISMFLRRRTTYSGATLFQGAILPSNAVTTMPSVLNVRFDQGTAQTGGNSVRMQGYWAGFTSYIVMNTGNSFGKYAWINTGAAQESGGSIDTGYAIYINPLPSLVARKYAINQAGSLDSSVFNGIAKFFNFQADKTITAGGTTGNQTINKVAGTVNFAAAATAITVTNSLITANSIVICTVRTNDATATIKNVVPGSGSFVITLTAAATAETSVGFLVVN